MAHAGVVGTVDGVSGGVARRLLLPAKVLAKAPVGRELANLVTQTPIQGVLGGIGEAGGELAAGQPLSPGNILAEVVGEAFSAPAEVAGIASDRVRAHAAALGQLVEAARTSKLRERDPAAFADLVQEATGAAEVIISADAFAQSMDAGALDGLPESPVSPWDTMCGALLGVPVAERGSTAGRVHTLSDTDRSLPAPAVRGGHTPVVRTIPPGWRTYGEKGYPIGQSHPKAKLNDGQADELVAMHLEGWSYRRLALHFGVSRASARDIIKGRRRAQCIARVMPPKD